VVGSGLLSNQIPGVPGQSSCCETNDAYPDVPMVIDRITA
jgi:hypothetical protein